jgi:hypothetical protein
LAFKAGMTAETLIRSFRSIFRSSFLLCPFPATGSRPACGPVERGGQREAALAAEEVSIQPILPSGRR